MLVSAGETFKVAKLLKYILLITANFCDCSYIVRTSYGYCAPCNHDMWVELLFSVAFT